jgi:hypothetical protein
VEPDEFDPWGVFLREELMQEFEKHGIIMGAQIQDSQPPWFLGVQIKGHAALEGFFRLGAIHGLMGSLTSWEQRF